MIAKKNIETGLSSDDYIEVTEGIEEGDTVIRDIGTLQEGMPAEAMASGEISEAARFTFMLAMMQSQNRNGSHLKTLMQSVIWKVWKE